MKRIVSVILIFVFVLCFSACNKTDIKDNFSSEMQNNHNDSSAISSIVNENLIDNNKQEEVSKKQIINVDLQNAKITFRNSNDEFTGVEKEYSYDKKAAFESYVDENIKETNITFLGKEYKNIPYVKSNKNEHKERDYNEFKDENVEVSISKNGKITFFDCKTPIKIFSNENKNSVELAKKYLNVILPDFEYDNVEEKQINYTEDYWYGFTKELYGISYSESVTIRLNSSGEFTGFSTYDLGKYDNIEIKGVDKVEILSKVEECIKSTYGNIIIDYSIDEDSMHYDWYTGNKIELTVPIAVNVVSSQGSPYTIAEYVVFELN